MGLDVLCDTVHGRVIAINADKKGVKTYVSMAEAFDYPMYGLQWHPEKVSGSFVVTAAAAAAATGVVAAVPVWGDSVPPIGIRSEPYLRSSGTS